MKNQEQKEYQAIIFDLGAVLIDWNPRYLYRKIFSSEEETEDFLRNICTADWNEQQDAGRSLLEGTEQLIATHPQQANNIRAFYGRWQEMMGGEISGTVQLLQQLKNTGKYKLYALTNWSNETFPLALMQYRSLQLFDGIVVSGREKQRKPDPAFYQLLLDRYQVDAAAALFIDDNLRNVAGAENCGIDSILFTNPDQLKNELINKCILF
ncbi:HAD family hydrolase [Chitinophaga nivalis]|uniref:HAD family phosphatase n=1 Tax=Chitinophaga nivalis TaxID=2991709 RepID=A0ABT3IG68_9BACT|nr:HAD family phosphatase [Chitinophaga nivalis]MCW3467367.1 HAD family phosphatase [Chitinophaga nivalis]MCW3482941.1 HAD family phosphatase [Chitinophaga nivalis]